MINADDTDRQHEKTIVMSEESGRHDPVKYYGPWAWIVGLLFGAGIMAMMFILADGFG